MCSNIILIIVSGCWRCWRLQKTWPLIFLISGCTWLNWSALCCLREEFPWGLSSGEPANCFTRFPWWWSHTTINKQIKLPIRYKVLICWSLERPNGPADLWPLRCICREVSKPLVPLGKAGVLLVEILNLLCKGMVGCLCELIH